MLPRNWQESFVQRLQPCLREGFCGSAQACRRFLPMPSGREGGSPCPLGGGIDGRVGRGGAPDGPDRIMFLFAVGRLFKITRGPFGVRGRSGAHKNCPSVIFYDDRHHFWDPSSLRSRSVGIRRGRLVIARVRWLSGDRISAQGCFFTVV